MKKIIFYLSLLFFVIILPTPTKAASTNVSLICPQAASTGEQIQCQINVISDATINGLSGKYQLNGVSYVNFAPQNGFTTYSASQSGFAVGNTSGKTGTFTIGVVTLKVNSAGSIGLTGLDASDTQFNSYTIGNKTASIRLKSTNTNLSSLAISPGTLSPAFSANTTSYSATIDGPTVTISATASEGTQQITGTGTKNLNYGNNTYSIVVRSESGATKTYTININRPDNRSSNNNLKSLSVSQGNISFTKNTTNYSINVESSVTSIKVNASIEDGTATFINGFGPRTVNLNYGNNSIAVKVQAQNGAIKTYTINVNRKDDRSTNNYLKSLRVTPGKIIFQKETLEYNMSVYYEITKIDVQAEAEDSKSNVSIINPDLVVGENNIIINVTAENQTVKQYIIHVKRLSEDEKPSDNNNITSVKVFGKEIKFKDNITKYEVKIPNEEKELIIEVNLEDERATYTIKNNENLKNNSEVTIIAMSESGNEKEYKLTIIKENTDIFYIVIALISLILGIIIGLIISNLKNKKANV